MSSTLASAVAAGRQKHGIALMPFIAAGYPDLETSLSLLPALAGAGASLIEVGFPFSDPIADGPVIQAAFTEALTKKIKVDDIFAGVQRIRSSVPVPLVAMLSYSMVFRYGVKRFVERAKAAGFDGLILPDLPPPEAASICAQVQAGGLDTVLLVSPTTPPDRRAAITRLSNGFVYYLSISGTTGERVSLPPDLEQNVRQIKGLTDVPVCVGFGISKAAHVRQLENVADGAIVGTGFVRTVSDAHKAGRSPSDAAEAYCRALLARA